MTQLILPARARRSAAFTVAAVNLEADELLLDCPDDYRVVAIDRYLLGDIDLPEGCPKGLATAAEFRLKWNDRNDAPPETYTIPLGSNVGDRLPVETHRHE